MRASTHDEREVTAGCYGRNLVRATSNRSDISEESKESCGEKKTKAGKKEARYYTEGGSSEEELVVDTKSKPSKKSTKVVFGKKKDKSKEEKKDEKGKFKSKSKGSLREVASSGVVTTASAAAYCGPNVAPRPVFGVPLAEAVRNSPSHDGVPVPVVFRLCIEYVTENGLRLEGIYRISAPKSTLEELRFDVDHRREPIFPDAYAAAGLLKLFLRELPEPVLTYDLVEAFESAFDTCKNKVAWLARLSDLVERLPACNRALLAYLFAHMDDVVQMQDYNRMSLPCLGLVLQPTLNISQRLLNCFLEHWRLLFAKVTIKRYVSPIRPSRLYQQFPSGIKEIEEELAKQESVLKDLHADLAADGEDPKKTEELWDVVRIITLLKREAKKLKKEHNSEQKIATTGETMQGPCLEMFEEKQLLAVQMQLREQIAAEQRAIAECQKMMADIANANVEQGVSAGDYIENGEKENEVRSEEEWRQLCEDLEKRRDQLIDSIIEERNRCAHLRACIEMITLSKQKEHEATRL